MLYFMALNNSTIVGGTNVNAITVKPVLSGHYDELSICEEGWPHWDHRVMVILTEPVTRGHQWYPSQKGGMIRQVWQYISISVISKQTQPNFVYTS